MKKFLLSIATIFTFNASAQDIRLSFSDLPAHNATIETTIITVDSAGLAKAHIYTGRGPGKVINLRIFLKDEMTEINHLIEQARLGKQVGPKPTDVACLAMPIAKKTYSADNGKLNLNWHLYPCGAYLTNESVEAAELVTMLDELRSTLNRELDAEVLRQ